MNSILEGDFEQIIDGYRWSRHKEFLKPAFGNGCIADIPDYILASFGVGIDQKYRNRQGWLRDSPDHLIFLLLDGFGFSTIKHSLEKYNMKYLNKFTSNSEFNLVTSVFPSTTSTATVSYHTNMSPIDHRIMGYTSYIPEAGTVCNMISLTPLGRKEHCLLDNGYEMPWIMDHGTIYNKLQKNDVDSFLYLPYAIRNSGLTRITGNGANISPYHSISQMLTALKRNLSTAKGKTFHFCYVSTIDTISHKIGPYTQETALEIESIFMLLDEQLLRSANLPKNIFMSISADHGHKVLEENQKIDLSTDRMLKSYLSTPVVGDARAPFMRTKEGLVESTISYLTEKYEKDFISVPSKELMAEGFFGTPTGVRGDVSFLSDIILIPKNSTSIFDSSLKIVDPKNESDTMIGMHGGLSSDEMLVPLFTRSCQV
ncbi:MAG: alkaline phosphatase family protein [Candidatus Thermoplasmatota archaeon]|nr:alkaline phosphatase family protein [Candidatus Thermoplasmatota archaeon]